MNNVTQNLVLNHGKRLIIKTVKLGQHSTVKTIKEVHNWWFSFSTLIESVLIHKNRRLCIWNDSHGNCQRVLNNGAKVLNFMVYRESNKEIQFRMHVSAIINKIYSESTSLQILNLLFHSILNFHINKSTWDSNDECFFCWNINRPCMVRTGHHWHQQLQKWPFGLSVLTLSAFHWWLIQLPHEQFQEICSCMSLTTDTSATRLDIAAAYTQLTWAQ